MWITISSLSDVDITYPNFHLNIHVVVPALISFVNASIIPDLSIDAMDVSGENQIDVDHNLFKQRLKLTGERVEDEPQKEGYSISL